MKRIQVLVVALVAAHLLGCGSGKKVPHMGAAGPPPSGARVIPIGYDPTVTGLRGAIGEIVYQNGGAAAWQKTSSPDTGWQAIPYGGGGSSYTPGTGIAIDAGVIAATSGFSSHIALSQNNGSGSPISTLDLQNNYTVNTAGSETVNWQATFPVGGVQIVGDLFAVNMAGKQSTTTSGSTPTATLPARCDQYTINVGANATTLTLGGLNSGIDGGYVIDYAITSVSASEIDMQVNGDSTGVVKGQYCSASCTSYVPNHLTISDSSVNLYIGHIEIRNVASGVNKFFSSKFTYSGLTEWYTGYTNVTADITTMTFPNVASGSKVTVQRMRPVAN